MTIIAAHAGVMVADSGEFAGARRQPLPFPKITRLPDGGLVACCGVADDSYAFRDWAAAGFSKEDRPTLTKDEDCFRALHMRPDGSTRIFYGTDRSHETAQPVTIGETTACTFVEGAMAAGASVEGAVRLACERCVWVAAPVQVERLSVPLKAVA